MSGAPKRPFRFYLFFPPKPEPSEPPHNHLAEDRFDGGPPLFVGGPATIGKQFALHKLLWRGILGDAAPGRSLFLKLLTLFVVFIGGDEQFGMLVM